MTVIQQCVKENIWEYCNHLFPNDLCTAKVLNFIINLIEDGKKKDLELQEYLKSEMLRIDNSFKFLDKFWELHREEFINHGFSDEVYIHHPLMIAYNNLNTEKEYLNHPQCRGYREKYEIEGKHTTGQLFETEIQRQLEENKISVKKSIDLLIKLKIIDRIPHKFRGYMYYLIGKNE